MSSQTALVFDYGRRRIGVAVANRLSGSASGLTVVAARHGEPDWPRLDAVVSEWGPEVLVSGLPYNADGSESEMTGEVRAFAAALAKRYGIEVETVDERLTSAEAETLLKEARQDGSRRRRISKEDVDRTAALLIAQSWLRSAGAHDKSNDE